MLLCENIIISPFYKMYFFGVSLDYKFSSGGREDVDVCMLGTGEDYFVYITNGHKCAIFNGQITIFWIFFFFFFFFF